MKTISHSLVLAASFAFVGTLAADSQTYVVVGLDTNASFATGINNAGQVSGYSPSATNAARAWRWSPGGGRTDLGSFGGADNRALAINGAGQVAGYSTDVSGVAHGFKFSGGSLLDVGGAGAGTNIFPQAINGAGIISGFTTFGGATLSFLATSNNFSVLGTILGAAPPATASAFGINDAGRVVGTGSWQNGFQHAFRTGANGLNLQDLGTLGGDESSAAAINTIGQVVGTAQPITGDSHAFLFSDGAGMTDLGTLGGIGSDALALNNIGVVVGSSQIANGEVHAFAWTAGGGMRDLNNLIPINAGWVLTEATGVNDLGQIVGNGLLNGQPRAFLLTSNSGADTNPPVALVQASALTNISSAAYFFKVIYWDDASVAAASIATNSLRVTGPGGFDQIATLYPYSLTTFQPISTNNAMTVARDFYLLPPGGIWNGTNNGVYSVAVEPNTVRDTNGNFMPTNVIGTFTIATETKPVISLSAPFSFGVNLSTNFTLTGLSSFPYGPADVFNFTIDWNNDGSDVQNVSGTTGTQVAHAFTSIGTHTVRISATDVNGAASGNVFASFLVVNNPLPNLLSAAPALTTGRRLAAGVNSNGTLVCFGGLPLKSGKLGVQTLAPGAGAFADAASINNANTLGLGIGMDALNRIVVFGGIEAGASSANLTGYLYTPAGGKGASIAPKSFPTHNFAFCADNLHRLYAISGAVGAGTATGTNGVERYDGNANLWTTLAPMPASRVNATATYDGLGHILVIGGVDPTTTAVTTTVYSYDIATDAWSLLGNAPSSSIGANAGRVAALGVDGMVYLMGGLSPALTATPETFWFDPALNEWFSGPFLATPRGTPAVALGNDGFIYVMGGDASPNGGGGNTPIATVEKINTAITHAPRITSSPLFASVQAGSQFFYQITATGNPRPAYALASGPAGMTVNPTNGFVLWTPTTNQVGVTSFTVAASNAVGVAQQLLSLTVTPPPGDVTPPTYPTNFFMFAHTATNVTLTWSAATDDVGVKSYNLWKFFRGSRSSHIGIAVSGITNRAITVAGGGTFYISAVDAAGNQSPRSPALVAPTVQVPNVYHVTASEPNTVIQGSGFLYTIAASASPSPDFTGFSGPAGMTFTPTTGPLSNNVYAVVQWQPTPAQVGTNTFIVSALNENATGSSTFTVIVLPGATDLVPPTPVALLTASGITNDRCNLSWTPAGDNIGVVNYHLVATHFDAVANQVITLDVPGANTNTVLTGLFASAGYTVTITPSDAAGNVGGATGIFFTTLADTNAAQVVTPPVVNMTLTPSATPGTLSLNWNGAGAQWNFTVEVSDSLAAPNWRPVAPTNQWPSTGTNYLVTPIPTAPNQYFRVKATLAP
jgi:probable HAF family extracellular repeat protein